MYFQAMKLLKVLAEVTGKTVTEIMEPHKELLQEIVPPKKHILRLLAVVAQIGIMVSFIFKKRSYCLSFILVQILGGRFYRCAEVELV